MEKKMDNEMDTGTIEMHRVQGLIAFIGFKVQGN